MAEPITTTAAVATSAVSTTAATSATATTAASTTAATATASETTLNKAAILRNLAKSMLLRSEMTVLDQSELVEEFAAPIYTGLAATIPNSNPTAKSASSSTQTGKNLETSSASGELKYEPENGDLTPVPDKVIPPIDSMPRRPIIVDGPPRPGRFPYPSPRGPFSDELPIPKPLSQPQPGGPIVSGPQIPNGLPHEISDLLREYYEAPTVKAQLENGVQKIVVERNLLDQKVVENGNKKTAICLIEERVIDKKYLGHGNLSDMISQIRHGHVPSIRQVYLAMIDLTDLATFKLFSQYFAKYKLEAALYRVRQLSADLEKKTIDGGIPRTEKREFHIERQVEKRTWYKTDHVTEKKGHIDTTVQKQMDLVALNVKNVCTVEMSRVDYARFGEEQKKLVDYFDASDQILRLESNLRPEQIAKINQRAMVWTKENILTTTKKYDSEDHYNRYGCDLKKLLGNRYTESDKSVSVEGRSVFSEYISSNALENLSDINTFEDATATFDRLHQTATARFDNQMLDNYIEQGKGVEFKDGWITFVPGGSIANLAMKSDLGVTLNKWDWIWAGVDAAVIALAIVTWGGASAAGKAATTTAKGTATAGEKAVGKATVRSTVKISSKAGAKATARAESKAATKAGAKAGAKASAKHAGKGTLRKVGTKTAAQNTAKTAAKVATKTGFKANTTYIRNGYKYITDAQGRVIKATGKLKNVPGVRNPANQKLAATLGKIGDEGGHLIPAAYGGPGSMLNHVPQTRTVNRSIIKRIENEMGRALKAGHKVEYTVMPHYPNPGTLRPDKFTIRYTIDGVQKIRRIPNV